VIGQNYKAEIWLIIIKEIRLFIYCPHLTFAEQMLFVLLQLHLMETCFYSGDILRLMKNLTGHFDGGGRERGDISWKVSLCSPALANIHKSISRCKMSKVSCSRPETDVCESRRDHVF